MATQIPVIDADGHVTESNEQVAKYLEGPLRRRPLTFPLYPQDGWDRRLLGTLGSVGGPAQQWQTGLDDGGMEMPVLYPALGLFLSFLKDRGGGVAICRAYNTFLHEEFIKKSPRLQAVALLPIQDPDAAAAELERGVRQLGLVGAMLAADGSHVLGDTRFTPIYETAQRLNVMLGIHASGSHLGGGGVELFPQFIQAHTCSHAFGQMRQLTSVIFEGIPERFPDLRIAFLEAGCGWAPYWMERMDEEYAKRASEAPVLRKKPSEYVRSGKIYFSCEPDECLLPQAMKLIGAHPIVYPSGFPDGDGTNRHSTRELRRRGPEPDTRCWLRRRPRSASIL